ncbi:MAG TPA: SRPBCC domain-containing protein [Sphingobium sp.]|uniref:SRPBCC family protein n=1 Tax=Sphingobium sp. TaxID=1912891 RepID=UPI002ED2B4BA
MNDATLKPQTRKIVVDEVFSHAPEAIWKAITQTELMARWLPMPSADFEPVVGNRFTFQTTPGGKWDGTIHCEVLQVLPHERFAYAWRGGQHNTIDVARGMVQPFLRLFHFPKSPLHPSSAVSFRSAPVRPSR